jgi:pimeloyl-ACP methyl ester carboxylesterase
VYTPTLTGLGERSHLLNPSIDLNTHITDVVAVLEYEDLTDVILAGHSYGGMVITGAADRATDRVAQLVYLDAVIPRDGESLAELASKLMAETRSQSRMVDGVELVLFPGQDPMNFYGVRDPEQIAWMKPKLTPHPWRSFEQPLRLTNEEAVRQIPRTIINCSSTLKLRPEPERMERVTAAERVWEIDTGHDLMISEPQAVAEMLLRLASLELRGAHSPT